MNTYTNQITGINDTIAALPKANSRVRQHFSGKRQQAKMEFLGRLHTEIQIEHPEWRMDDEVPQTTVAVPLHKLVELKVAAPSLTDEYLAGLGVPTTLASMSNVAPTTLGVTDDEDLDEAKAA